MQRFRDLDIGRKQLQTLQSRSFFIFIVITLIFLVFSYQILRLMVLDNVNYVSQSDQNRIITVPIYPARGLIYNSEGNIIVEDTFGLHKGSSPINQSRVMLILIYGHGLGIDIYKNPLIKE